jgi:hypothetical protein
LDACVRYRLTARAVTLTVTLLAGLSGSNAPAAAASAALSLKHGAITSAGVFDSHERLVRTLWGARQLPAGVIDLRWDGRNDDGEAVDRAETYAVRVLVHHVRYVWEGVIANTSSEMTGAHVHRALFPISGMAIDAAGDAFFAVGYNELHSSMHRFRVSDPQRPSELAHGDYRREFEHVATDGERVYFANIAHELKPSTPREATFVIGLEVRDGTEHRFAAGQLEAPKDSPVSRWESVIDYYRGDDPQWQEGRSPDAASGLAVQRHGMDLFVAHAARNEIRVFHKVDGWPLGAIALTSPLAMAVDRDDSLWVICRDADQWVAAHYLQRGDSWQRTTSIQQGLSEPVAIAVSPIDGAVLIVDAGTDQLKAFSGDGTARWTYGWLGGYRARDPRVTTDRFWFSGGPTYVAFQADGSFWVGDPGNVRNLHFSAQRKYLGQILYLPETYASTVDPADPTRVFGSYLEFKVDYRQPIARSWTLVRNWGAGAGAEYVGNWNKPNSRGYAGLRSVVTVPDGRTLGVARRLGAPSSSDTFELTSEGIRRVGRLELGTRLYADGSQRGAIERLGSLHLYERRFAGSDAEGNPAWEPPREVAAVPRLSAEDPYDRDVPLVIGVNDATYPDTASGLFIFFAPGYSKGFHLGAMRAGTAGWLWRASPTRAWEVDKDGNVVAADGSYEADRRAGFPGSIALALGRHIIYGYHGEGWNGGEANQWLHFYDNGLFIGQFGIPEYPATTRDVAPAGSAGNSFCPALVQVNGQMYLWHNDESVHSGLHRWRIEGANEVELLSAPIAP